MRSTDGIHKGFLTNGPYNTRPAQPQRTINPAGNSQVRTENDQKMKNTYSQQIQSLPINRKAKEQHQLQENDKYYLPSSNTKIKQKTKNIY
jgi:hypothetical protein